MPMYFKRCRILVSFSVRPLDAVGAQPRGRRSGLSRTGKHFTISVSLMRSTTQGVHRLYSVGGRFGVRERTGLPARIPSRIRLCLQLLWLAYDFWIPSEYLIIYRMTLRHKLVEKTVVGASNRKTFQDGDFKSYKLVFVVKPTKNVGSYFVFKNVDCYFVTNWFLL